MPCARAQDIADACPFDLEEPANSIAADIFQTSNGMGVEYRLICPSSPQWRERLGNFMRTLVLPDAVEQWSLTTLREKLVKIGAKIVRHGRYIVFQMAEVAIPRDLFADILRRIDRLRTTPLPT